MLQPVIKWSGSKRSQAPEISKYITKKYDTYYELFCGGCSVLYYILNNKSEYFNHYICVDINKELIELFNLIKSNWKEISVFYKDFWNKLNKDDDKSRKREYFNLARNRFNTYHNPLDLFCIMRTTTNGMPRYNKKGEFNNSFHITRNGIIPNKMNKILEEWSDKLNQYDVHFGWANYIDIEPKENDLVYADPPYANTKGMYYGTIDNSELFNYLRNIPSDYLLSFDGVAGDVDLTYDVPKDIYDNHILVNSGNSSFRRTIGKSNDTIVKESLYLRIK